MTFLHRPNILAAAAAALIVAAAASPVGATPATRYVDAAHGSDANACTSAAPCASIQRAVTLASAGDTIDVATGTYTASSGFQVVDVTGDVALQGGWDAAFTTQAGTSTIDGQNARRGVQVEVGVTASLARFVVQNGATVNTINGGGIRNFGTLTVSNSLITQNGGAEGAGIANGGTLTLVRSTVSNQNVPSGQG